MGRGSARTALVTGGSGYVGSHVARRLIRSGWDVHLIVRKHSKLEPLEDILPRASVHIHDGSTEALLKTMDRVRPDVVFHLAASCILQHEPEHIVPMLGSNIVFGTQLVEAMTNSGVRCLVNTGTASQHWGNSDYNPATLYAATKQAFETLLVYYAETTPLKAITLKLYDTYGPGDFRPKLLPSLLMREEGVRLPMSPGGQWMDMVYIDDVADAYVVAAERLLSAGAAGLEHYAVSSGKPVTLKELIAVFERVSGKKLAVDWGSRPYRPREAMVHWSRGTWLPGWQPMTELEEGIRRMLTQG